MNDTPKRTLGAAGAGDSHLYRELKHKLKIANKTMGRQGTTIANLRGELARVREEHSKIERGELRRLENFEVSALGHYQQYQTSIDLAHQECKRLREKLDLQEEA